MTERVRVLIADDRPRSREGLRALLTTSPAIDVIGEAGNGQEAISLVHQHRPDVVLMDVRMPVMNGLDATHLIKTTSPDVKVIILTLYPAYRREYLAGIHQAQSLAGPGYVDVDDRLIHVAWWIRYCRRNG